MRHGQKSDASIKSAEREHVAEKTQGFRPNRFVSDNCVLCSARNSRVSTCGKVSHGHLRPPNGNIGQPPISHFSFLRTPPKPKWVACRLGTRKTNTYPPPTSHISVLCITWIFTLHPLSHFCLRWTFLETPSAVDHRIPIPSPGSKD